MKWLGRIGMGLGALALLLAVGVIVTLWIAGSNLTAYAEREGWMSPPPEEGPLTVFEETAAKAIFANSWNVRSFPCRGFASIGQPKPGGMPVSTMLASEVEKSSAPLERTLWSSVSRVSAGCLFEMRYSDQELLRFWLRRAPFGRHQGAEAASSILFGKPTRMLSERDSLKLIALNFGPGLSRDEERWASYANALQERLALLRWDGDRIVRAVSGAGR